MSASESQGDRPAVGRPEAGIADRGYSGRVAAEVAGVTYRQLDYWARTGLTRPSLTGESGGRRYSYRDLLELRVLKALLDSGVRLDSARSTFAFLRDQLGDDLTTGNLVISGQEPSLVRSDEELLGMLSESTSPVLVLPLAGIKGEVDAGILDRASA